MRILFAADVEPDWNSGAAGTELHTIGALRELGHEVDEIWRSDLPHRISHGNLHYLLELPRGYRKAVEARCSKKRFDVIQVNQSHGWLAARDHHVRNRPGVFLIRSHGLEDRAEETLAPWRTKLSVSSSHGWRGVASRMVESVLKHRMHKATVEADGFVVSCSMDRDYLINHHGMAPFRVGCIPQAAPDMYIAKKPKTMNKGRLRKILYISSFAYFKGPNIVADAITDLAKTDSELEFTWVCDEKDHHKARRLVPPDIVERIRFLPWMTQEELMDVYDAHGIFLYPSLFEGFGKVFLEAIARGLCVIVTPTGGMRDIVRDGVSGFLVPPEDSAAFAARIRYLVEHPDTAARMATKARSSAIHFCWLRVGRETAAFYQRIRDLKCQEA